MQKINLRSHLAFILASTVFFLILMALLRASLLIYNWDLSVGTQNTAFVEAFFNGLRFDLKLCVFIQLPLILAVSCPFLLQKRRFFVCWLSFFAGLAIFLSIVELNFYKEFHQRLNNLFFQYLSEDPKTVLSMLWYGFPVVRLLLACAVLGVLAYFALSFIEKKTRCYENKTQGVARVAMTHMTIFIVCLLLAVLAARSTLRQGAPLRWGDAFTTSSLFANQLGLNPVLSLANAARNRFSDHRDNIWKSTLPKDEAWQATRDLVLTKNDKLIDTDSAVLRRISNVEKVLPIKNVVVILMESFAGRYVGALGSTDNITPNFDALAKQGLLFTGFFSNGTHTHQGMFATMACFPNLPAFEYLMQTPEGGNKFSGLPQLLDVRHYQNVYVYNGDFAWDNQRGFFSNQGMSNFVGRGDFINPVFSDPTWGVSDQDMFDRAVIELNKMAAKEQPFYGFLQTLSNHTPYALPNPLPVKTVTGHGSRDEHLTAMRYADWALGRFFEQAKKQAWYNNTLFVLVGDHGFGAPEQLTDMDLFRFYVPMLMIAPGIQEQFGQQRNTVATQVDIVPTIMGLLGGETKQQCWGRDLLHLPSDDQGYAIIKPSGGDQTVAMVKPNEVLVKAKGLEPRVWQYDIQKRQAKLTDKQDKKAELSLYSYLQSATQSLLDNTTGIAPVGVSTETQK